MKKLFFTLFLCATFSVGAQSLILNVGIAENGELNDNIAFGTGYYHPIGQKMGLKATVRREVDFYYSLQPTYVLNRSRHYQARVSAGAMLDGGLYPMAGLTNLFTVNHNIDLTLTLEAAKTDNIKAYALIGFELKV